MLYKRKRKPKGAIKNEQSRDTGNIWHKTQDENQQSKKHNTENQKMSTFFPFLRVHNQLVTFS